MAPGDVVGRFRLEAQQDDGSWRARDVSSGAFQRIRFVVPFSDGRTFLETARPLTRVRHDAVVRLVDAAPHGEGAWLAEEWLAGETLQQRVERVGPLPFDQLFAVANGLLTGLRAIHEVGLRDGAITPERLRIIGTDVISVHLVLPGLGCLLTDLAPDPDFAAPEGSAPTVAADLYGSAATLCFAAHGSAVASGQALELAAPILPPNLVDALRQCLDTDPTDRPHSVEPLLRAAQTLVPRGSGTLVGAPPRAAPPTEAMPGAPDRVAPMATTAGTPPRVGRVDPNSATDVPPRSPQSAAPQKAPAPLLEAPHFDFSGFPSLSSDGALGLEALAIDGLTVETAPPVPTQARPEPRRTGPVAEPDPPLLELDLPVRRPSVAPQNMALPLQIEPVRPRPRIDAPVPVAPPDTRRLYFITGGILVAGIAAITAWWAVHEPPQGASTVLAPPFGSAQPVNGAPPSLALTAETHRTAAPARDTYVRVVADPGPGRFVQISTGVVLCESAEVCNVPIDVATRIEKAGYQTKVLEGDDLYDRRGGRWKVKLYPGR